MGVTATAIPTLVLVALLGAAPPAAARVRAIEGVAFAERVTLPDGSGPDLRLQGLGLLRYRAIFRAYVAAFYLPDGTPPERALADVPKRLEIRYFWSIDGEDFGRAAETLLARQLPPERLEPLRDRLDALHAAYRTVQPGDRYALTYTPGAGTVVSLNGEPIAVVPGADFAAAYFGIWLGDDPLDAALREHLLGAT